MQEGQRVRQLGVDLASHLREWSASALAHWQEPVPLQRVGRGERTESSQIVRLGACARIVEDRSEGTKASVGMVRLVAVAHHRVTKPIGGDRELDRHERLVRPVVHTLQATVPRLASTALIVER